MGQTSIPCRSTTHERLDELRGDRYESWDAFLNHMADVWEDGGRIVSEEAAHELMEEIAVAAEPEGGMVDDTELAREVSRQVDYAELATKVADELEGRMR